METYRVPLPVLDHGLLFRGRRAQLGLSLEDLRRLSSVSMNSLRNLELEGRVKIVTVLRLAPHLQLTDEQALLMLAIQQRAAREGMR